VLRRFQMANKITWYPEPMTVKKPKAEAQTPVTQVVVVQEAKKKTFFFF
jgi:hypothetical protein